MTNSKTAISKTGKLVRIAVLAAIILLMNYTPLGYLRLGPVEITFMQIPVLIGAIMIGPGAGAFLGLVFGLTSLAQAPVSPLFAPIFATYPMLIVIVCLVPRILVGFLSGLLAKAFRKAKVNELVSYAVTGAVGSALNTTLFIGSVLLLLQKYMGTIMGELGLLAEKTVSAFWIGIGLTNGIPEAIVSSIIVLSICKALQVVDKRRAVK